MQFFWGIGAAPAAGLLWHWLRGSHKDRHWEVCRDQRREWFFVAVTIAGLSLCTSFFPFAVEETRSAGAEVQVRKGTLWLQVGRGATEQLVPAETVDMVLTVLFLHQRMELATSHKQSMEMIIVCNSLFEKPRESICDCILQRSYQHGWSRSGMM